MVLYRVACWKEAITNTSKALKENRLNQWREHPHRRHAVSRILINWVVNVLHPVINSPLSVRSWKSASMLLNLLNLGSEFSGSLPIAMQQAANRNELRVDVKIEF
jgi:hypothetical protein